MSQCKDEQFALTLILHFLKEELVLMTKDVILNQTVNWSPEKLIL